MIDKLNIELHVKTGTLPILSTVLLAINLLVPITASAKGEVTHINAHIETTTRTDYDLRATHPAGSTGPGGIEHNYTWLGQNQVIDSFEYNGKTYNYDVEADKVSIKRADNPISSGERCTLFLEDNSNSSYVFTAEFPRLRDTNNCDTAAVMSGKILNRGALDVFNNGGGGRVYSATNIERVDFVFSGGITAPYDSDSLSSTGIVVTEKSGNNDMLVAAVLSIDTSGAPASYSKPIYVHRRGDGNSSKYAYGLTNIGHFNRFINNEANPIQDYPYVETSTALSENLGMAFVDLEGFGITAGQVWYGFSYFSPDVGDGSTPNALGQVNWKAGIDPVNYAGFPLDTDHSYEYGDADLYGGIGGYFVDDELNTIKGKAYKDNNKNGILDTDEIGIPNIKVTLYKDDNNNGSLQPSDTEYPSVETDSQGNYNFIGVPNGNYFVVIDKNDAETPVGYFLNQNDLKTITINDADSNNNNYPYIDNNSSTLSITKSVSPAVAVPNQNLVYTITVTNTGDSNDATGVQVVDVLSSAVSYVSDDSGGNYNQSTGLWTVGTVNKNTSKTLKITVKVN